MKKTPHVTDNIVVRILLVAVSVIPLIVSSLYLDVVLRVRSRVPGKP